MNDSEQMAGWRVAELVAAISSNHLTPGAGSAGAVALALAAACARKAASISLKHQPSQDVLLSAAATFQEVAKAALADADRDAAAFAEFVHSPSSDAAARLVREGQSVGRLIDVLLAAVDAIEPLIETNMAGDVLAARALAAAARAIQHSNEGEIEGA